MIPNSKINAFENLFADCVFERRYIDQASDEALGAVYNGNAAITTDHTGKQAKVLTLDGTGDYIDMGNLAQTNFGTGDFSVEIVFKRATGLASGEDLCSKRNGSTNIAGFIISISSNDTLFFEIDDGAGNEVNAESTSDVADGIYKHSIITFDRSGNATFYVNGASDGTQDISSVGTINNTISFLVGRNNDGTREITGQIALVRLWNKALTATEANQLAATEGFGSYAYPLFSPSNGLVSYWPLGNIQNDSCPDIVGSSNGTTTNLTEADLANAYNQYRSSLDFNGSDESISIGDLSGNSIQAVSFWAKPDSTSASFIQLKSSTQRSIEVSAGTIGTTGLPGTTVYNNGKASTVLQASIWNNILVVFNAVTDADDVLIGKEGANFYDGKMADVIMWNRQPTPLEIELFSRNQLRGLKL